MVEIVSEKNVSLTPPNPNCISLKIRIDPSCDYVETTVFSFYFFIEGKISISNRGGSVKFNF